MIGDYIYGICSYGQFRCLRATTGDRIWESFAVVGEKARGEAWAKIDRELVEEAVAVPYQWAKEPYIESKDVAPLSAVQIVDAEFVHAPLQRRRHIDR